MTLTESIVKRIADPEGLHEFYTRSGMNMELGLSVIESDRLAYLELFAQRPMMKVIIAGSRSIWSYQHVDRAVFESGFGISEVICGMAPGVDSVGWAWAFVNNVPTTECPADWNQHGKSAGVIRNREMLGKADALIAVHDGNSRGTADMIKITRLSGKPMFVLTP